MDTTQKGISVYNQLGFFLTKSSVILYYSTADLTSLYNELLFHKRNGGNWPCKAFESALSLISYYILKANSPGQWWLGPSSSWCVWPNIAKRRSRISFPGRRPSRSSLWSSSTSSWQQRPEQRRRSWRHRSRHVSFRWRHHAAWRASSRREEEEEGQSLRSSRRRPRLNGEYEMNEMKNEL